VSPSPSSLVVRRFVDLAAQLAQLPSSCGPVRLVAVDGPGGAGKSTFAGRLAAALDDAQVIPTDDFASWDEPLDWFPRFSAQVIEPLAAGRTGRYQRYDWVQRQLAEWRDVRPDPIVVIEGVGAARSALRGRLAFAIWVETAADLRLARGIERDGEDLRGFWDSWIKAENAHYAADRTLGRADLIVDGAPALPHDPELEFIAAPARQP
jgi:uridine kinase